MTISKRSQCVAALYGLAFVLAACGAGPGGAAPAATISARADANLPTPKARTVSAEKPVFIEFYAEW
jgi:hypothetical protein